MEQETGLSGCWETYFQQLQQLVLDIESRGSAQELLELLKERTAVALQSLHAILLGVVESRPYFIELIEAFQTFYQTSKREIISIKSQHLAVYQFSNVIENLGQAGRPRVRIQEETLLHFQNIRCSWKEIAELLMVSRWTTLRRVRRVWH